MDSLEEEGSSIRVAPCADDSCADDMAVRSFREKYPGQYMVVSRLEDPLFAPGKARLIWRANTAYAAEMLGLQVSTVFRAGESTRHLEANPFLGRAELNQFYGTDFKEMIPNSYSTEEKDTKKIRDAGQRVLLGSLLPYLGFVHNRDPSLLKGLLSLKVPFLYEDHNEDYHESARLGIAQQLNEPVCKLVVAITEKVRTSLIAAGVDPAKIVVLDSGVSSGAFLDRPELARRCRRFHCKNKFTSMAVYSGGLQDERGMSHIFEAASSLPDVRFVLAGGSVADVARRRVEIDMMGLRNVHVTGYLGAEDTWVLQQAADVLLLTREPGERAEITSPLKLFEYMASARPIVHYEVRSTGVDLSRVCSTSYDNNDPGTLAQSISRSIESHPWDGRPISMNRDEAASSTWLHRIRTIVSSVGKFDLEGALA